VTSIQHKLSVKALVDTTVVAGDINFRFTERATAIEGIRGHQRLQKSRGGNYQAEVSVSGEFSSDNNSILLSGRIDGMETLPDHLMIEEIKTHRGEVRDIPEFVKAKHRAQALMYGFLLLRQNQTKELPLKIRVTYLQLDQDVEHYVDELMQPLEVEQYGLKLLDKYFGLLRRRSIWLKQRNQSIEQLDFPHQSYREGQREFAVAAYRALKNKSQVVLQAPTGIGKSIGSLFPAIKSLRHQNFEKVFFVTAKTIGREAAEAAVNQLSNQGLELRSVSLTAKDKICFNPGSPCDPEHCEYAAGYYDRVEAAVNDCLDSGINDRGQVEKVARVHQVCPFELSLDVSRWSDLVIADYNYVFDPRVYLRRYFDEVTAEYALLIDECHNLIDRGRDMFSASLDKSIFLELKRILTKNELNTAAGRVNRAILGLKKHLRSEASSRQGSEGEVFVLDAVPEQVIRPLRQFSESAEAWLQQYPEHEHQPAVLECFFVVHRFLSMAELFDENYRFLFEQKSGSISLKLYCINPAPFLKQGFSRVTSSVLFSATLSPPDYYQSLIGVTDTECDWFGLASPFSSKNLGVYVCTQVATNWRERESSLGQLAALILEVLKQKKGNYLIYFPSYRYLNQLFEVLPQDELAQTGWQLERQSPEMSEAERVSFLQNFRTSNQVLGLAVMGGIFGEGIDLQGAHLIGVIVVGVGLPQIGVERDLIREHFDIVEPHQDGFAYAYQYPGLLRVLQTAGRVIRDEQDVGIVCLVDPRFGEQRYLRHLPEHWDVKITTDNKMLAQRLNGFWAS